MSLSKLTSDELAAIRHRINEDFTTCRSFGHSWDIELDNEIIDVHSNGEYTITGARFIRIRCVRCLSERIDLWDSQGNLQRRRYVYPIGYKYIERQPRGDWRVLLMKRYGMLPP